MNDNTIKSVDYSEKAFAVYGDTKSVKDMLKTLGGKFNPHLTHPVTGDKLVGWIFSKKRWDSVKAAFPALDAAEVVAPAEEVEQVA